MKVAIDGPAGSGKSTVAREIARHLHLTYLDTGAMYRAVTLAVLRSGIDGADEEAVSSIAQKLDISFVASSDGLAVVLNGEDVTKALRTPQIDTVVSRIASYPAVREAMVARQRILAATGDVIAEGRDIGTVVFPDAEVKVFLSADAHTRAHRRTLQRLDEHQGEAVDEACVLAEIQQRDAQDTSRQLSPLRAAEDAHHIDSSHMSIEEVCQHIEELIYTQQESKLIPIPTYQELAREGSLPLWGNKQKDYFSHGMGDFPFTTHVLYHLAAFLVFVWTKLMWRWHIEGEERLYKTSNGVGAVIVMNHVSMLDPVIPVLSALATKHRTRPIYKSEFDDMPALGWLITRFGGISVRRDSVDMRALRSAKEALLRGESILIFPEGTRIKSDDEPVEIHGGFTMIAQMAAADIIPTAIVGARDITPRGKRLPRPGKVWVQVGRPIPTSHIRGKQRKQMMAEVEGRVMQEVYALRDELRRKHPGNM